MRIEELKTDDGVALPVRIQGEGTPLVILPGWTGGYQEWEPITRRLDHTFRFFCWDARPYRDAEQPEIHRMARDLQNLFDRFDLDRPVLLGHSMGALTAWEYMRQYGCGRIGQFVVVDQSPKLMTDSEWSLGLYGHYTREDDARFVEDLQDHFAETVLGLIGRSRVAEGEPQVDEAFLTARRRRLKALDAEAWIRAWESFVGNDYRPVLPTIDVPTMLAYGARSNFYGPAVAEYVRDQIPGSELFLYPEAGHAPPLEAMAQFLEDLPRWVARHRDGV